MITLAEYKSELLNEWNYAKNNIDPSEISYGSSKKVWWKCDKGHEWEAIIWTRIHGVGCPYCKGKRAIKGINDFATLYPSLLDEWDYCKNDELNVKPDEMLIGSQRKVYWICNNNHSYMESIYNRIKRNNNCPYCSYHRLLKGFNDFASCHGELLEEWDYKKNDLNNLKPDNIICNGSNIKAWWKCNNGHEWYATIRSRVTGHGCPICSNNKVLNGFNDLETTNPEIIKYWNYEKNKNDSPLNYSHGSTKKVWWKCDKGHEWKASISSITRGNRCPYCSNQKLLKGYNDLATKYPDITQYWDYKKNNKNPADYFPTTSKKVWWKCEKGHSYRMQINAKTRGNFYSCPVCNRYKRVSVPEKIILFYLNKCFDVILENYTPSWLNKKELDIFIPQINTAIEYDGFRYHKNIEDDLSKDLLCDKNKIKLIRVREKSCEKYSSNSIKIYTLEDYKSNYKYMIYALEKLKEVLNIDYKVNLKQDLPEIYKMLYIGNKSNCIAKTDPNSFDDWDYNKNNSMNINPMNVSRGSNIKVYWICPLGHSYKASISTKISQNTGCPYCNGRKILEGFNDLASNYPYLIKEWDYEKNIILPEKQSKWSLKKVWWKCNKEHSYQTTISNKVKGDGCPICSGHQVLAGYNDIATVCPKIVKEWDFEKNNEIGLEIKNYTKGNDTKAWWICPKGHSYFSKISDRISGRTGCPYCSGKKVLEGFNDLDTTNPNIMKFWNYSKNDLLNIHPNEISNGSTKKVWWKCEKGHEWEASVSCIVRGTRCPYCSNNKVLKGFNDLKTTNPELLKEWDYKKNNENGIFPECISKSYSKKVWWKCCNDHSYQSFVYNKRNGYGKCPYCKKKNGEHI